MATPRSYVTDAIWLNLNRGRFTLTAEIIRSAGWVDTLEHEELVAEIVEDGHIRLHRRTQIQKRKEQDDQDAVNESTTEDALQTRRQVLADRYHDVKFSRADNNRVVLRPEVVMAIVGESDRGERIRLFIQAGDSTVDVMTNTVRMSRLKRNTD